MNKPKDMLVSEPTRYTSSYYDYGNGASGPQMEPDAIGEYVTYLDYAKLRSERDELAGALREQSKWLTWVPMHHMDDADQSEFVSDSKRAEDLLAKHKPE